jgi:hypothetical protein
MSLDPNATLVANRLKGAGYTRAQIAGVLGNFQLESGFNPRINEGGVVGGPRGVGGYGLGQWTGDRQTALVNFAKGQKADPGNTGIQADFLLHELGGPEKAAAASLRKAVSPEEASRRFLTDFERAGIPKTNERMQAARALYDKLSFLDKPQQTATSSFAAPSTSTNKSVEDILASVIGGAVKPELEDKNNKAKTLVEMVMQSVLPGVLSTTSPAIPPNPFALY